MGRARDRWLDEGVEVLAEEGAAGIRIDRLAVRLGLSKGSFHHHFDGAEAYKHDLLAHVEQLLITSFETAVREPGDHASTRDVLTHLTALVDEQSGLYRPGLEVGLRAWATWDRDAATAQAQVDEARLDLLRQVWRATVDSDEQARRAALLPYLIAVGASVMEPPVSTGDLRALFEQILTLVPPGQELSDIPGTRSAVTSCD